MNASTSIAPFGRPNTSFVAAEISAVRDPTRSENGLVDVAQATRDLVARGRDWLADFVDEQRRDRLDLRLHARGETLHGRDALIECRRRPCTIAAVPRPLGGRERL